MDMHQCLTYYIHICVLLVHTLVIPKLFKNGNAIGSNESCFILINVLLPQPNTLFSVLTAIPFLLEQLTTIIFCLRNINSFTKYGNVLFTFLPKPNTTDCFLSPQTNVQSLSVNPKP